MNKYAQYFAIEKKLLSDGIPVDRSVLVQEFTKGTCHSLTDLNEWQYVEFQRLMRTKSDDLHYEHNKADKCNQIRRKIIALFHKMDWKTADGKIDFERLDAWCIKYSQYHKSLNQHSYQELVKLCTQVENVYKTFIESL